MYRYIFFNWIRASFILFHFLIYIHISICTFFSNWKESPRRFSSLNLNDLAETIVMLTYCVWCWNFGVPVAFPLSLSSMRLNTTVLMVSWRFFFVVVFERKQLGYSDQRLKWRKIRFGCARPGATVLYEGRGFVVAPLSASCWFIFLFVLFVWFGFASPPDWAGTEEGFAIETGHRTRGFLIWFLFLMASRPLEAA